MLDNSILALIVLPLVLGVSANLLTPHILAWFRDVWRPRSAALAEQQYFRQTSVLENAVRLRYDESFRFAVTREVQGLHRLEFLCLHLAAVLLLLPSFMMSQLHFEFALSERFGQVGAFPIRTLRDVSLQMMIFNTTAVFACALAIFYFFYVVKSGIRADDLGLNVLALQTSGVVERSRSASKMRDRLTRLRLRASGSDVSMPEDVAAEDALVCRAYDLPGDEQLPSP